MKRNAAPPVCSRNIPAACTIKIGEAKLISSILAFEHLSTVIMNTATVCIILTQNPETQFSIQSYPDSPIIRPSTNNLRPFS